MGVIRRVLPIAVTITLFTESSKARFLSKRIACD
jgi:hypothetical protein